MSQNRHSGTSEKKDKFGTCYVQHMTFVLKLDIFSFLKRHDVKKARYLSKPRDQKRQIRIQELKNQQLTRSNIHIQGYDQLVT